jgi:hypothetical protein
MAMIDAAGDDLNCSFRVNDVALTGVLATALI